MDHHNVEIYGFKYQSVSFSKPHFRHISANVANEIALYTDVIRSTEEHIVFLLLLFFENRLILFMRTHDPLEPNKLRAP